MYEPPKKLLLIAFYFPPDGGAGAQRPAKFCRYLPALGWEVTVLTRSLRASQQRGRWDPLDDSLLADVQDRARIVRVGPSEKAVQDGWPSKLLRHTPAADWLAPAYGVARELVLREQFDCVLITMSPFWLNHLGRRLKEETGVPVVYDLRDPWALDGWQPQRTYWHWHTEMRTMRVTLETADGVVANTPEAARRIQQACPGVTASALTVVTNGYDEEDLRGAGQGLERHARSDEFVIVHSGTLHEDSLYSRNRIKAAFKRVIQYSPEKIQASGRTVLHLLRALRRLRHAGVPDSDRVRIALVGPINEATKRCIDESGVSEIVSCSGYVTHDQSVRRLLESDALFLPLHGLPAGQRSLIVPGKTYEYLAAGKPILGCLPEGDARDLVAASGMGYLANPTDDQEIADGVAQMLTDWRADRFANTKPKTWVKAYERRELCRRLNTFLRRICRSPASAVPRMTAAQSVSCKEEINAKPGTNK